LHDYSLALEKTKKTDNNKINNQQELIQGTQKYRRNYLHEFPSRKASPCHKPHGNPAEKEQESP